MKRLAAFALPLVASCVTTAPDNPNELVGVWSGQHASLEVGTLDAGLEFDCAEGMIAAPYRVANDGSFEWGGTFTRGSGGPDRAGEEPLAIGAVYYGRIKWPDDMRLNVKLNDGHTLGPFDLKRGAEPQIYRCL